MTSGPYVRASLADAGRQALRLRLKPKAPRTGFVDGAWWPRSRDLSAELPALAEVLAVRLGPVRRVAFALSAWDDATHRIDLAGHEVRLEGFPAQDRHVVHVTGADRLRISLLVVPPEASEPAGHTALMTAAARDNAESPITILVGSGVVPRRAMPALQTEDTP